MNAKRLTALTIARDRYIKTGITNNISKALELYNAACLTDEDRVPKYFSVKSVLPATSSITIQQNNVEPEFCPLCEMPMVLFPPCCTSKISRWRCRCGYSKDKQP